MRDYINTNNLTEFHENQAKNVASSAFIRIPMIWPSDLVFESTLTSFELVQDFFETNILAKIYNDWAKNVASNALTRIFYDLT